ncbi:low temperature requirement protein A, partial [Gammaproteobacteria bacterium]|nr:low temperature requirement protein A [Gammaproteobacteria bacterium]
MALGDNNPLWRAPRHHHDLDHAHDHVHWMELFYDLIHVVMIFMLGNFLSDHHDLGGFFAFVGLFSAMWLAWGESSVYNSLYISTDWVYRLSTAFQALSVLFMAAAIPGIEPSLVDPGKGFAYYVAAYGVNRIILGWMYHRAIRSGAEKSSLAREQSLRLFGLGAWYLIAALLPAPWNVWMFVLGVLATQAIYMIPRLTVMRLPRFTPRFGHFTERFALFLLIVNGEGFFKLVAKLGEKGIYKVGPEVLANVAFGGLGVFVLTWIYFDYVGNVKPRAGGKRVLYAYWLGHMVLMMGAVMIGVALAGEVYVGFWEPFPTYYGYLGCGGLILYLVSLYTIQWAVEPTAAHRFATPSVLVFGVLMAVVCVLSFPHLPSIFGNLLWSTALFSQLLIPFWRAWRTLSREEAE